MPNPSFESPYQPTALREWLEQNELQTLPQLFARTVESSRHQDFLGAKVAGSYLYQTYGDIDKRAQEIAAALLSANIEPGDRVAQLSGNRPEWVIVDLAVMRIGSVHVPLYTDQSESSLLYHLDHSQSRILFVETSSQLELVLKIKDKLPLLQTIIHHSSLASEELPECCQSFTEFLDRGAKQLTECKPIMAQRSADLKGTDVCSLVYTSGTTGEPKGVMLMHGNFLSNALSIRSRVDAKGGEIALSILPLSHVLERVILYLAISVGGTIAFAEGPHSISSNLQEVRPHFLIAVPRLYEKVLEQIYKKISDEATMPRMKRRIFDWAVAKGAALANLGPEKKPGRLLTLQNRLAERTVFQKIQQKMGGRVRTLASGGARLDPKVAKFFRAAGFRLVEGYGLTETSPVITMNALLHPTPETVGKALIDVQVRLESNGEISVRGPNIMLGYFRDWNATQQAIDPEGWFKTGDIGRLTGSGLLSITGRIKDMIVLSNGKNIVPSPIEHKLESEPLIDQIVLVGEGRKFLTALVVIHQENCQLWKSQQSGFNGEQDGTIHPALQQELMDRIDLACQDFPKFQRVKKIAILPRPFSAELGEVTPTLKLRRNIIAANFDEAIEQLYKDPY